MRRFSCLLRLSLPPEVGEMAQTFISEIEWLAALKCRATGLSMSRNRLDAYLTKTLACGLFNLGFPDIPYLWHWKFGGESEVQKEYFYYIFTRYILILTSSHHSVIHCIPPCFILLCSVQYFPLPFYIDSGCL